MVRRAVGLAILLALVLTGCQGVDRKPTPTPEDRTPTPEATVSPGQPPTPNDVQPNVGFNWRIGQAVGTNLTNGSVGQLVVVAAHPAENASLAVEDAAILLQHDDQTLRIVHESATSAEADGTFSVDPLGFDTSSHRHRFGTFTKLSVTLAPSNGTDMALETGDNVTMLVTTPDVTTEAVTATVPDSLTGEVSSILYGEFAETDQRNESMVVGKPQVVSATGNALTDDGAGVVNVTVTKLPGSASVDFQQASLRLIGPNGSHVLTHAESDTPDSDGHFGLTPVRDADGSAPILTDGDRFRLTLDLGTDTVSLDDGPAGASVGTPLDDSFETRLVVETAQRNRYLRLALPENATTGPVDLRGVIRRSVQFPRTNQRPTVEVFSSDSQRTENGQALGGLSVNIRKPPTADPIDPRTLSVEVATATDNYTLVHPSRSDAAADGHFGLSHQFNPDGSAPLLDDFFDLARLTVDLGRDTRPSDDGALGNSVGENVSAGQVVNVTVQTEDGVAVPVAYYVTERSG